jgi:hypothetical protein
MPKHKTSNALKLALANLPAAAILAQDKGGEAKSLTVLAAADRARISGVPTTVVQVDDQGRLPKMLGPDVVTIRIDPKAARKDPSLEQRAFTPLYQSLEASAAEKGLAIVEFGANMSERGAFWAGMVDLEEELDQMGMTPLIITPYGTSPESMRLGARAATGWLKKLPRARLVLIENERDGLIQDLHPASDAAAAYREAIVPLRPHATVLRMPLIEGSSWRLFESAGVRPADVVTLPIAEIMKLTGLPKPEAKIARGDIAAWLSVVFQEFDSIIDFNREADHAD